MNAIVGVGVAVLFILGVLGATGVYAQKIEEKNISVHGKITAIDLKKKTVTIKIDAGSGKGKEKTVAVDYKTKIQKNNQIKQRLVHLAVDDEVSLMYRQGAKEPDPAIQIIVLTPAEKGT